MWLALPFENPLACELALPFENPLACELALPFENPLACWLALPFENPLACSSLYRLESDVETNMSYGYMTGRFVPRHKGDENDRRRTAGAMPTRRKPAVRTTPTNS
jgi:hypothetical protein